MSKTGFQACWVERCAGQVTRGNFQPHAGGESMPMATGESFGQPDLRKIPLRQRFFVGCTGWETMLVSPELS